jgi:hypothetical protein
VSDPAPSAGHPGGAIVSHHDKKAAPAKKATPAAKKPAPATKKK